MEYNLKRYCLVIAIIVVVSTAGAFSQGESAVPFLLTSPYAEANGMGEASVANFTDDPLGTITNPAHLGIQSLRNYFLTGYNHSNWLPGFNLSDLSYTAYAVSAGINLGKQFGITPDLSVGVGYSRVYLNLGEFIIMSDDSPDILGTFNAYETSDQYSLGAGIDCWVKASMGVTFKHIYSELAPFNVQGQNRKGVSTVNSYDYGLLLGVPFVGIFSRVAGEPIEVQPNLSPFLDLNLGLAKNNLGDQRVVYIDAAQADPLPRSARVGIGFDFGFSYNKNDLDWQPLSFKWTIEANDLLVRRFPAPTDSTGAVIGDPPPPEYREGLGDIKFFDEVILGHTNPETIKKKGSEINFGEIFFIRGGRFEEDPNRGNRRYRTSGFGIRFAGFIKLARAMGGSFTSDPIESFIIDHIDIRYNESRLTADEAMSPLGNTKFSSISILISN